MKTVILKDAIVAGIGSSVAGAEIYAPQGYTSVTVPSSTIVNLGDSYDEVTNEFTPAPLTPVVPASVSPRQIRQALTRAGLRAAVEAAVAAGDQDIKDWYEFATTFERTNPKVAELASALSVTEQQLDDLWTLASTL